MAKKTKAEVEAELAAAVTDEEKAQAAADEAVELTPEEEAAAAEAAEKAAAIADAAQKVADAKKVVDAAQADHAAAVAEHKALVEPPPVEVVYGKHILVDLAGSGQFAVLDAPKDWESEKPRRLIIAGRNVEHVSDHPSGAWCYRGM